MHSSIRVQVVSLPLLLCIIVVCLFILQAQQVHSMFPHVPLQAITLDLVDTHSVSLTVDRILSQSIYIPEQLQGTPLLQDEPRNRDRRGGADEGAEGAMEEGESGRMAEGEEKEAGFLSEQKEGGNDEVGESLENSSLDVGDLEPGLVSLAGGLHNSNDVPVVNDRTSSEAELSSERVEGPQCQHQLSTTCQSEIQRHEQLAASGGLRQRMLERLHPSLTDKPSSSPDLRKSHDIGRRGDKSESFHSALFFSSLQERKAELLQKARRCVYSYGQYRH